MREPGRLDFRGAPTRGSRTQLSSATFACRSDRSSIESHTMKQTILTAVLSAVFALTLVSLLAKLAPGTIVHWLGGVTKQEIEEFRERTVQEGIPFYIWQGRDGSDNVRRLGSADGAISLAPRNAAQNEFWHVTVLRK